MEKRSPRPSPFTSLSAAFPSAAAAGPTPATADAERTKGGGMAKGYDPPAYAMAVTAGNSLDCSAAAAHVVEGRAAASHARALRGVLPSRRPSPRCFVLALSRRLAAAAAAEPPVSTAAGCRGKPALIAGAAAASAALPPPANCNGSRSTSAGGGVTAGTNKKRLYTGNTATLGVESPFCELVGAVGAAVVRQKDSSERTSGDISKSHSNNSGRGAAAGSSRSSNSSVATTAAAASSWGASSEEDAGEEGNNSELPREQRQREEQHQQRPIKLFRNASSRCCFATSLPPVVGGTGHSKNGKDNYLAINAVASLPTVKAVSDAADATSAGRAAPLPLPSVYDNERGRQQLQTQGRATAAVLSSIDLSLPATHAAVPAAPGIGGLTSTHHDNSVGSKIAAAARSTENVIKAGLSLRSRLVAAQLREGGGGAAGVLCGSVCPQSEALSDGANSHQRGEVELPAGESARHLKLHQQTKLRFKAVAATAACRGVSGASITVAAAKGENVRRKDQKKSSNHLYAYPSAVAAGGSAAASFLPRFPLTGTATDGVAAPGSSSCSASSSGATSLLQRHQQSVFSSLRMARGWRDAAAAAAVCASTAAAASSSISSKGAAGAAVTGAEKLPATLAGPSSKTRCAAPTGGGGTAAALAAERSRAARPVPALQRERRGREGEGAAAGVFGSSFSGDAVGKTAPLSGLVDKSFGNVSERCRLLICDTSEAYGEDAGIDNVHNTKLAQFCYDQAAFKADKAQPGDYTANSRRLSPEGRDLLVCVVNKVAAQLAQNTAATTATSFGSSSARADACTTPASDPLSPRAAATVAIAIQLFDRFMQVVYQNDLHYGVVAEHRLHPLYGLSAYAALPAAASGGSGGGGAAGGSGVAAPGRSNGINTSGTSTSGSNTTCASSSLLNQLIAIACFCFADRVEAIYAYEYPAVLEAWRQQSPPTLTQAWKATAAAVGGVQGLSTALLKEKLMHLERKIISHVPPNGGNVSVAPLSELAESLLNVAVQFAFADSCSSSSCTSASPEDGALSEASTASSPTSVSKGREHGDDLFYSGKENQQRHQHNKGKSRSSSNNKQQQLEQATTSGLNALQRRDGPAAGYSSEGERQGRKLQDHPAIQQHHRQPRVVEVAAASIAVGAGHASAFLRRLPAAPTKRDASAKRYVFSGAESSCCSATLVAFSSTSTDAGAAPPRPLPSSDAPQQKCCSCCRGGAQSISTAAAAALQASVCQPCMTAKQRSGLCRSAAATTTMSCNLVDGQDATKAAGLKPATAGTTAAAAAVLAENPYALRPRISGSNSSDVPRLIAQLLVRLGQLDRRICLDFRPSVIAAAAVHIALVPRQGDLAHKFSTLSPAARAIAVQAVVAAGGAACYRLVRRCQSMLMHKWVKVKAAMDALQRSNNPAAAGEAAGGAAAAASAVGSTTATGGGGALGAAATAAWGGSSIAAAAIAGGLVGTSATLPERLVAEWAVSRLTLPAHRHMLEVLHHLADLWMTYAAARMRSNAAQKQQQQQQMASATAEHTTAVRMGSLKRTTAAAADAGAGSAAGGGQKGAGGGEVHLLKSSKSNNVAAECAGETHSHHPSYSHQLYPYHHRSVLLSRSCNSSAEELLLGARRMVAEAARRKTGAGGGGASAKTHALLLPLLKTGGGESPPPSSSSAAALAHKGKLLQPLGTAALLKTASPLRDVAAARTSISSFATLAGLHKELRMMERASIGLKRLQKLSLEKERQQLLLQ